MMFVCEMIHDFAQIQSALTLNVYCYQRKKRISEVKFITEVVF